MTRLAMILFSTLILMILSQLVWVTHLRVSQRPELDVEIRELKSQLQQEKLRLAIKSEQLGVFQAEVAALLPDQIFDRYQSESQYPLRKLASVISSHRKEAIREISSFHLFQTSKELFNRGEYAQSNRMFEKFLKNYGYSVEAPEAYFLLIEGQVATGKISEAIENINHLVELFPESELTGFSLVRLGQIHEQREKYEAAISVYRQLIRTSPYQSVVAAATQNLRKMEP